MIKFKWAKFEKTHPSASPVTAAAARSLRHAAAIDHVFPLVVHGDGDSASKDLPYILALVPCGSGFGLLARGRARFISLLISFVGPDLISEGPNKRVDLIFQKSGRPDSRARNKFPLVWRHNAAPSASTARANTAVSYLPKWLKIVYRGIGMITGHNS